MNIEAPAISLDLLGDTDGLGVINVDTTNLYVGAEIWVQRDSANIAHLRITKIIDSTHLQATPISDATEESSSQGFDGDNLAFSVAVFDGTTHGDGSYDAVLEANTTGVGGNALTIALVGDSAPAGGVSIVRTGTHFVIHYEDGVSVVGDVNTAIGALAGGDALFHVLTAGGPFAVLNAPGASFTASSFGGGVTPRLYAERQLVRVNKKFTKKLSA